MTDKKAILIIGAGDATGGAIARRFAREGYIACVTRRTADKLEPLVKQIKADGGQAHVMYSAMWEQARNMDDPDEIAAVLREAGLDGPALLARAQDPEVKARLAANTQSAFERGAFGSPSFFVGDQLFFGKDRLREVEEEIVRQRSDP